MALSKSRTITLVVAISTLISNTLWSILFHQLADDTFHLASTFGWYLHFANILSVFGFIGAVRHHALSISIFSNYLIFDTFLCAIPRLLVLICVHQFASSICTSPDLDPSQYYASSTLQISQQLPENTFTKSKLESIAEGWSDEGCAKIVALAQLTLAAGCFAAALLQFVGALRVRDYAKRLVAKEVKEEEAFAAALDAERAEMIEQEDIEKR